MEAIRKTIPEGDGHVVEQIEGVPTIDPAMCGWGEVRE